MWFLDEGGGKAAEVTTRLAAGSRREGWYIGQRELHENANIMGGLKSKQIAPLESFANMQHQQ